MVERAFSVGMVVATAVIGAFLVTRMRTHAPATVDSPVEAIQHEYIEP